MLLLKYSWQMFQPAFTSFYTLFYVVNVLEHDLIRSEIKNYSDWPTIPQLYVKGEFVGGCDIMTSMFNDGSMEELMKEKKLMN